MNEPEILYHYTTAIGLMGIVQSQTLRATNAEFLNDAQELQFGRPQVHDALLKQADELSPHSGAGDANTSRASVMRSAAYELAPDGLSAGRQYHFVYVACFCEAGDLLSQWRSYGASGGYTVGFRTSHLRLVQPAEMEVRDSMTEEIEESATLVKVRYGDAAVEEAVTSVLGSVAPKPVSHLGVIGFHRAQSVVLPALAGIKHAAFSEEREWRLVVVSGPHKPSFRVGPLGVTPYIGLRYPTEAIAEIVIGPGPEQRFREQEVELLVGENVTVRSSSAPFRG
jgi:Protein of unknown function (DUF2971)